MGIGFLLVFLLALGHSALNPPHRDISAEKPDYVLSAQALSKAMGDPQTAMAYGDKVIQVGGRILFVQGIRLELEHGIIVILSDAPMVWPEVGDSILLKARCVGYDQLLEEVRLDRASIVKND